MKKLQISDLTPAVLTEVAKFSDPKEVSAFFAEKDFEVSEQAASKILDHIKSSEEKLSDDVLDQVAGGSICDGDDQGYPNTGS